MLTRSSVTPGTVRSSAHGSREFGTRLSSSCVKLVAVPIALASMIGDSPVTVTVSCTVATPSVERNLHALADRDDDALADEGLETLQRRCQR